MFAFSSSELGGVASPDILPTDLKKQFTAEQIVGIGAFGRVIKVKKKDSGQNLAIKLIVPEKDIFSDREIRRLLREVSVHELFMSKKCEHAVHLASITGAFEIQARVGWLVLEHLNGEDMHSLVYSSQRNVGHGHAQADDIPKYKQPIQGIECIGFSRSVLAALKVMHAEGLVHRDIKPANIVRHQKHDEAGAFAHKLIDFGSAIGVDETVAKDTMMTLVENRALMVGTLPYMSPEMFKEPNKASYPTDIWSLGVTMFELVVCDLPFHSESEMLWGFAIAGNMNEKAPSPLDVMPESLRSNFDHNLSKVIAKALEKKVTERYVSADEMHDSLYSCLIQRGEASYSVFISYRVTSEAPLARLLFDELNHSVTPGGHRVTVYWDSHRLVKGEPWEEGFATGVLNSICFLPLLSHGFTAPLAVFKDERSALAKGWEAAPVGRKRLEGAETDPEDNCLKELLIAVSLLEQRGKSKVHTTQLQTIFPLLVGRQEPSGHPDYPRMGNFFDVQGGGGYFADQPSPPTSRAVAKFLLNKAGMTDKEASVVMQMSIKDIMNTCTRLQGCQLWDHPKVCFRINRPHMQQLSFRTERGSWWRRFLLDQIIFNFHYQGLMKFCKPFN